MNEMHPKSPEVTVARNHNTVVLAIAEEAVARRLLLELAHRAERIVTASDVADLQRISRSASSALVVLDWDFLGSIPRAAFIRELGAPVILIAKPERQSEAAALLGDGIVEFVARIGNFAPILSSLIERRLRQAERQRAFENPAPFWSGLGSDLGTIFRHEINNPLTGILGNAELVLAHSQSLSPTDAQRLQTVVELAVRLRETVRRLSSAWESRQTDDRKFSTAASSSAGRSGCGSVLKSA